MIEHMFVTPIGIYDDIDLAEQILPTAEYMLESDEFRTDEWGYKTTFSGDHTNQNPLKDFEITIIEYINSFRHSIGSQMWDPKYVLLEMFVSDMRNGDTHPIHCHPNSQISGVFYLKIPKGSNAIRFFDPRPIKRYVKDNYYEKNQYNSEWHWFSPQAGKMLIWESHLDHEVPPTSNTDGRITLVFNAKLMKNEFSRY